MKKIQQIILILSLLLIFSLTSCANKVIENENQITKTENSANENVESQNYEINLETLEYEMITPSQCLNKCGNGLCDTLQCLDFNCTCEETTTNCAVDCK